MDAEKRLFNGNSEIKNTVENVILYHTINLSFILNSVIISLLYDEGMKDFPFKK